jgi:S1-C subfamily serine protease
MTRYLNSHMRISAFGSILLIFLADLSFGQTTSSSAARIAKANLQSVVTLVALDDHEQPLSLGSGFFTSATGLVATNAHVIEGATKIIVRWLGKSGTATRIVKFDPRFDVAIVQTSFSGTPIAKLGDSDLVTVGEEVVALGSPYGLEGTVSTGIISGIRPIGAVKYLQITAPISPGSSGGPIFNGNAVVIGIATAAISSGQNLNFALPANILKQIPDSNVGFTAVKHIPAES